MAKIKTYANDNTINANDKLIGTDFNDSDKTKNYLISELKNYILNGLDIRPYKVYTALLSQTGTNAPVATVLENTFGFTPIWQRDSSGVYFVNNTSFFDIDKTLILVTRNTVNFDISAYANDNDNVWIDVSQIIEVSPLNVSAIENVLNNTSIEIRVYN